MTIPVKGLCESVDEAVEAGASLLSTGCTALCNACVIRH